MESVVYGVVIGCGDFKQHDFPGSFLPDPSVVLPGFEGNALTRDQGDGPSCGNGDLSAVYGYRDVRIRKVFFVVRVI